MYLVPLMTLLLEATQAVFGTPEQPNTDYPNTDFQGIWTSLEYPAAEANYPGIWVTYQPSAPLQVAGIGHREYGEPDPTGVVRTITKWRFGGTVSFTCAAMTSFERYRLIDAMIEALAFGKHRDDAMANFQRHLDANDLIGLQMQWDQFGVSGLDENQGTPWGTDDIVYEGTLNVDCQGEFASDVYEDVLIPLSAIVITPYAPGEAPPDFPGPSGSSVPALTDWQ